MGRPADAPAEVICRFGEVPSRLDRPDHTAPIFQTSGAGEYLLLPGTGRVLVRNGNAITVQPDGGASANLSAILTGPILAVLGISANCCRCTPASSSSTAALWR